MATNICTSSRFRGSRPAYPEPVLPLLRPPPLLLPLRRLLLGDSVLLLHPQYQASKCARLSSLCRNQWTRNILLKSLFAFQNKTLCTFFFLTCDLPVKISTKQSTSLCPLTVFWSCPGHELLVFWHFLSPRLQSFNHLGYPAVTL